MQYYPKYQSRTLQEQFLFADFDTNFGETFSPDDGSFDPDAVRQLGGNSDTETRTLNIFQ